MHAVLVANGPLADVPGARLVEAVGAADAIVGIDGGARTLLALRLTPTHVTGDFDSLGGDEREALARRGVCVVPTPDQDYTDLDKALAFTLNELGADSVAVFGATGGRLDHTYSVLSTLVKYGQHHDVRLVDAFGETRYVRGELVLQDGALIGRTLSLMALGPVGGVTTTGVRWPLTDEALAPGIRDGTLNEISEATVTIACRSGALLVLVQHAG